MRESDLLYFARAGDMVKIGRTTDIDRRLNEIQVGCPHEIEEMTGYSRQGPTERDVHARLAHLRIRGEWFRWSAEVQDEMRRAGREVRRRIRLSPKR